MSETQEPSQGNPEHRIPGMVSWNELATPNAESSIQFYADLFGWKAEAMEMPTGTYTVMNCGKTPVAGVVQPQDAPMPQAQWMNYVTVSRLEDTIEKAVSLGATVLVGATPLPMGRFAVLMDPQGAPCGIYEYGEEPGQ